jgi:hypothetical protein
VPQQTLLKELVRALGLPESFYEEAQSQMEAQASQAAAAEAAQGVPPDASSLAQQTVPMGPNNLQSIIKPV